MYCFNCIIEEIWPVMASQVWPFTKKPLDVSQHSDLHNDRVQLSARPGAKSLHSPCLKTYARL